MISWLKNIQQMGLKVISLLLILYISLDCFGQDVEANKYESEFDKIDFNCNYYPEKAEKMLADVKRVMNNHEIEYYQGHFHYIKAQLQVNNAELDSALIEIELAISFFTQYDNKLWLARSQLLLGKVAELSGLYEQAKINYYESIKLVKDKTNLIVGLSYLGLARCKKALREEPYSEEHELGIDILKSQGIEEIKLYAELMDGYFKLDSPSIPQMLNPVAIKYIELSMFDRAAGVYKIIASSFYQHQKYDSAQFYCDKALYVLEKYDVTSLYKPALFQFKGLLHYKQKNFKTATYFLDKSLTMYEKNSQLTKMLYSYNLLHKIYKDENNFPLAYEYLIKYLDLSFKAKSSEKVRLAKVLEINNKVDLMKSQLVQLNAEKRASEFMLYLVVVITFVILGGVGIYIYQYQKTKKAKIEELNKEFHNLLIGIGEKQLLQHRLSQGKKSTKLQEEMKVPVAELVNNDEGSLEDSFDSCYMETINLFTESFPQLTKTEVRYAVMICLKLPVEVIAKVQNVQPGSIRKAKQRIRTKLNVGDNLEVFLQEFREQQISSIAG